MKLTTKMIKQIIREEIEEAAKEDPISVNRTSCTRNSVLPNKDIASHHRRI